MQLHYKSNRLERILIGVNIVTAAMVAASVVALFGFKSQLPPEQLSFKSRILGDELVRGSASRRIIGCGYRGGALVCDRP